MFVIVYEVQKCRTQETMHSPCMEAAQQLHVVVKGHCERACVRLHVASGNMHAMQETHQAGKPHQQLHRQLWRD